MGDNALYLWIIKNRVPSAARWKMCQKQCAGAKKMGIRNLFGAPRGWMNINLFPALQMQMEMFTRYFLSVGREGKQSIDRTFAGKTAETSRARYKCNTSVLYWAHDMTLAAGEGEATVGRSNS
jgi:hypothetical protein